MSKQQLAQTQLKMALKRGNYEEILKRHENMLRAHMGNVLIDAVKKGHVKTVRRLIKGDRKIPPVNIHHPASDNNTYDDAGEQAIHIASRLGKLALVRLLLRAGANPNAKTRYERYTPLHSAAMGDHRRGDIARELLAHGASVDALAIFGDHKLEEATPLMLASMKGNLPMVRVLIAHGADVNARWDRWGQTAPLHYAVSHGHVKIVQFLLNHGANINILDTSGKRPIHQVGYDGNSSTIAKLLVKHGAQNTRDNRKKLATERFMPKNAKRILQAPTRIAARKELQTRSLPPELISTILQYANLSNAGPHTTRNESKNNERLVPSRKRKSKKNTPVDPSTFLIFLHVHIYKFFVQFNSNISTTGRRTHSTGSSRPAERVEHRIARLAACQHAR